MNRKLNFIIVEEPKEIRTNSISDLCDYLTAKVLEPKFAHEGYNWDRRFMNFFSFDNTCDPLEPTGTIRFRVPVFFTGKLGELEEAIVQELKTLGIKVGPLVYESLQEPQREPAPVSSSPSKIRSRLASAAAVQKPNAVQKCAEPFRTHSQTMIIPVIENPTGLITPPNVNMAYSRGSVVLRDLLEYKPVNGRYEFTAQDILQRIAAATDEKIAACTASPVSGPEGVRRTPSAISVKAIKRCLEEIKAFALWASKHNYQALAAA